MAWTCARWYGSTEKLPQCFVLIDKCANGRATVGHPYPGIEIKCIDDNGNEVPAGVQGEEISTGPHLFVGYLDEPSAPIARLTMTAGSTAATLASWKMLFAHQRPQEGDHHPRR